MSSEDLPWFCKGTMWLRTAEKLHVNLCKSPHSHVHWNDSKACCKSEYFLQLLCCRYDEVTSSNPLPMSTGRRLKMVFCVAVEPRADGNADLSLQSQDSTSLVRRVPSSFSPCPCQHFTMAKGDEDCSFHKKLWLLQQPALPQPPTWMCQRRQGRCGI